MQLLKTLPNHKPLKNRQRVRDYQRLLRGMARILIGIGVALNALAATNDNRLSLAANSPHQALVLFYTATCPHCQRFVPILKRYADASHLPVLAFTLDGGTLPDFPDSLTPSVEEVRHFFRDQSPVVPVVFWIDGAHQTIVPVLQGEATLSQLTQRMQLVIASSRREYDEFNRFNARGA